MAKGKAVASLKDIEKQLAEMATGDKARVAEDASSSISIKGAKFTHKDEILGNELAVIVLGFVHAHDDYDRDYDPDATTPPACFARSLDGHEMQPMPESPAPVAEFCNGCPNDAFGSANVGEGKHCRNSYRLAVMEPGKDVADAEIAFLSLPPTTLKNWDKYVKAVADTLDRPTFGVITRFTFDHSSDWPKLEMEVDKKITDAKTLGAILARVGDVQETLMQAPDVSGYEAPGKSSKQKAAKKSGNKKTSTKKKTKKKTGKSKFAA